jgi:hypothetical protein
MLRFIFWALLIINVLLLTLKLALDYGYLESFIVKNNEPYRLKAQLNTDKVKLISINDAMNIVENNKKSNTIACLEVGKFTQPESMSLEAVLKNLNLGERQTVIEISETTKNMVYIPAIGSKDAVEKKSGQLRKLGIIDFHQIEDKSLPAWSISLGVFKTPEAAKAHLANMIKKGIKDAKIAPSSISPAKYAFRFKDVGLTEKAVIDTLKEKIENYQVNNCTSQPTQ